MTFYIIEYAAYKNMGVCCIDGGVEKVEHLLFDICGEVYGQDALRVGLEDTGDAAGPQRAHSRFLGDPTT